MNKQILQLKQLNAAYTASLEYDHCPAEEESENVNELFETEFSDEELKPILNQNEGRRPDEIAREMSELIKELSIQ